MKKRQKGQMTSAPPSGFDHNIEDTARLMTRSSGSGRTKRIILAAVSVVLIAAIAVTGILLIRDKRYNDQVKIADQKFAEGDYEQAEAEYLKAIELNKRKPKAREGLAYTYAIQGKYPEATDVYDGLYKDTGDEKYKEGGDYTRKNMLPPDPDLIPAKGIWRETDPDSVAYIGEMHDFLYSFYIDKSWDGLSFDCKDDSTTSVLTLPMTGYGSYFYSIEDIDSYEWGEDIWPWYEWIDGIDPRGWAEDEEWYDLYGGYERYEEEGFESMLKEIFNISDDAIENMLAEAEADRQMYKEDGYYYCVWGWPTGVYEGYAVEINSVMTDGTKYCICYDAGESEYFNDPDWDYYDEGDYEESTYHVDRYADYETMYALVEIKVIDGEHYISLYYNGHEMPEEVANAMAAPAKEKSSGSAEAYRPVIEEYRDMLIRVGSGEEFDPFEGNNGFQYVFGEMIPHELNSYVMPEYAIKDINGDGVEEMVVGASFDNTYFVGSIITLDSSGSPVVLYNCQSFMYRADLDVYEDGTIAYSGSGGADYHSWHIFAIEGTTMAETDTLEQDFSRSDPYLVNGKTVSEDEFDKILLSKVDKKGMSFKWHSF